MLRRFCNFTGNEIDINSPMDLAPDILHLLTPLNMNLFQSLIQLTKGAEFKIGELGFKQAEDGGIDLTVGIACETFLQYETEAELAEELTQIIKHAFIQQGSSLSKYIRIAIPFKLKK